MTNRRVVLGATGPDDALSTLARMLRDSGHEVVLIGGDQSAEQLVRTALAEDAAELVVIAGKQELARVEIVRKALGADDIKLVEGADLILRV